MKCPFCGKDNTKVIDSRPTDDSAIRRRRQCDACGKRFTTYEKVESMPLIVIKKDNNREPYDREKLTAGIVRSCHKRPVSLIRINAMVDEIVVPIVSQGDAIGSITVIPKEQDKVLGDAELKAAEIGASFLAKQMES